MNDELTCRVGAFLLAHSDFVYDPCNLTMVLTHLIEIFTIATSILVGTRFFKRAFDH